MGTQNLSANRASINEAQINTLIVGSINYMNSLENSSGINNSEIITNILNDVEVISTMEDNRHIIVQNDNKEIFYVGVPFNSEYNDLLNKKLNFEVLPIFVASNVVKNPTGRYLILSHIKTDKVAVISYMYNVLDTKLKKYINITHNKRLFECGKKYNFDLIHSYKNLDNVITYSNTNLLVLDIIYGITEIDYNHLICKYKNQKIIVHTLAKINEKILGQRIYMNIIPKYLSYYFTNENNTILNNIETIERKNLISNSKLNLFYFKNKIINLHLQMNYVYFANIITSINCNLFQIKYSNQLSENKNGIYKLIGFFVNKILMKNIETNEIFMLYTDKIYNIFEQINKTFDIDNLITVNILRNYNFNAEGKYMLTSIIGNNSYIFKHINTNTKYYVIDKVYKNIFFTNNLLGKTFDLDIVEYYSCNLLDYN